MTAIAIIPARGGSTRIPNKNRRLFHGRPIIEYSIDAARQSGLFDRIVVSTDCSEIGKIARAAGCFIYARDQDDGARGTQDVTAEALRDMVNAGWQPDFACCIYPTAPLMDPRHLELAFDIVATGMHAYAYSVHGWQDAGQFYMGAAAAFLDGVPLSHFSAFHWQVGRDRFCDINTEADFRRAEEMYVALHQVAA